MVASFGVARAQDAPDAEIESLAASEPVLGVRVGAARALRLVDFEGKPLAGIVSEPKWETRGGGLFFTREFGGTRNVWRAFPDQRDGSRYPRWRALPVTQFVPPLFARTACPLEGDRAILMLSNAANPRGGAQVTFFDLARQKLEALTTEPDGVVGVAPAPDGQSFAFASTSRDGTTGQNPEVSLSVRRQNMGTRPALREPRLVARNAWHPAWQSADLLLVEGISNRFIFRCPINDETRRLWGAETRIAIGSEVCASRDGSTLVLVGKTAAEPQLYLVAGDGSGSRALNSTAGAQSPALSGDGRFLAFIAPLASENRAETARAIWIMPLQPVATSPIAPPSPPAFVLSPPAIQTPPAPLDPAPTRPVAVKTRLAPPIAQIKGVQVVARGPGSGAAGNALRILGVASGEGATATLEIGQGAVPARWISRQIALPLAPGAPLLVWTPPAPARGIWNFRLTVSSPAGAAQSRFSLQLPLASQIPAPVASSVGSMPAGGPLPRAPLPDLPGPPLPFPAPLPPLLPAPPAREPGAPGGMPPIRSAPPKQTFPAPVINSPDEPLALPGRDVATFNVSDTLAEMRVGQRVSVTFWALNRGTRAWDVGEARGGVVRLVTRWVRFDSGNRNGWTYQNMKTPVVPGARARWSFDLVAPAQPGRYKLIYALQRVPSAAWTPPAYNAPQETWPNDFAAIAFAVTVKPLAWNLNF